MKYLQKLTIIFAVVFFCASAYAQDKTPAKPFIIQGSLSQFSEKGQMILTYFTGNGRKKDTANIVNGKFELKGTAQGPMVAYLTLMPLTKNGVPVKESYDKNNTEKFYLEPGETKITGTDNLSTATIAGGPTQVDWLVLTHLKTSAAKNEMYETEDLFITKHPSSYVSWDIIKTRSYINEQPDKLERLFLLLDPKFKNSEEGQLIGKNLAIAKKTVIGKPALEFTLNDTAGKAIALKSFRGKYVLIDFWASWCGPCRGENPNVLNAYQQLKDKNFDVIAISLDSSRAPWMKAVHEDKMPWTQLSDLKGWKSAVAVQYGISSIPQNFLIDPNGIIIAKNLRGSDLSTKLEALINK